MARQNEFRRPHDFTGGVARRVAGDFTADRRMLLLIAMAIVIGAASTAAAWLLVSLIAPSPIWSGLAASALTRQHWRTFRRPSG